MIFVDKKVIDKEVALWKQFMFLQVDFWSGFFRVFLGWLAFLKSRATKLMYHQRGRFSQSFVNASMAVMAFLTVVFSGKLEDMLTTGRNKDIGGSNYLIMATDGSGGADTLITSMQKGEVTEYAIKEGDTLSSIAQTFGVSMDTILWENNLKSVDAIKPGQIIRILPVTGVKHKVRRGETVYGIAKTYQVDAQTIIDYPFNTFADDENFTLMAGQELIVPEGIKPREVIVDTKKYLTRTVAPIPGVVGEGNYMWPTSGRISQKYYWYHKAVDVANASNPNVVASQGGTVVTAGWNAGGYGNYVVIDHGNGFKTLYGHMLNSSVVVKAGQVVKQGQKLGVMGSTGRSTGTHLHFEVKGPNGNLDPLTVLK